MHRRPLAETGSAPQDGSDHSGGISVQVSGQKPSPAPRPPLPPRSPLPAPRAAFAQYRAVFAQ